MTAAIASPVARAAGVVSATGLGIANERSGERRRTRVETIRVGRMVGLKVRKDFGWGLLLVSEREVECWTGSWRTKEFL
jgi:hypothetical protein